MDVEKLTDRLNAPVQGTAADGLKLALTLLWERRDVCPRAVPVLVCHDEVVVECDADRAEEGKEWLVQTMKDGMDAVVNVMEPHIPIDVKASISKTWGVRDGAGLDQQNQGRLVGRALYPDGQQGREDQRPSYHLVAHIQIAADR
jgi:hypothetical protein